VKPALSFSFFVELPKEEVYNLAGMTNPTTLIREGKANTPVII